MYIFIVSFDGSKMQHITPNGHKTRFQASNIVEIFFLSLSIALLKNVVQSYN